MPAAVDRNDPFKDFNFIVEIDGTTVAGFSVCSGLASSIDVVEYREGSDSKTTTRKLPGRVRHSNITLKRGVTDNLELYNWFRSVVDGTVDRRNGSIVLLDDARNAVARWNFFSAWPAKWEGPTLDATGNEVAIESFELACEDIRREG